MLNRIINSLPVVRQLRAQIAALSNAQSRSRAQTGIWQEYDNDGYFSYEGQIQALRNRYNGTAKYGCAVAKSVILLRTAFISGAEVKIVNKSKSSTKTKEFFEKFLEYNKFNYGFMNELVKESEIEGKSLLVLNPENETVRVRYVSYQAHRYHIEVSPNDYTEITQISYGSGTKQTSTNVTTLSPDKFVFVRFGGNSDEYVETFPRLGALIRNFDSLDMALCDWRQSNSLFASPTPWINFEDVITAEKFTEDQRTIRDKDVSLAWKVGKLLVTANAEFKMVTSDNSGQESLQNEIMMQGKIISAGSGVPVHFLGLPELMSNRSTADNLRELIEASTEYERSIWVSGINELKDKVIAMANRTYGLGLNAADIELTLPYVGQQELDNLSKLILPIRNSGALSTETFVGMMPFVDDPAKEIEKIKKEAAEMPVPQQNMPGVDTRNQDTSRVSQRAKPSGNSNQGLA